MAFKLLALLLSSTAFANTLRTTNFQQSLNANAPRNYIINSGAESNDLNVTDAGGIVSRTTTTPLEGDGSFIVDAASSTQKAIFTANDLQQGLIGQSCEATANYMGDATLYKAYVTLAGVTVSTEVTLINSGSNTQAISIIFPCGASTTADPAFVIEATGNGASIEVDSVYLGKALSLGTVAQGYQIGLVRYGSSSCANFTGTSASLATLTSSGCNSTYLTGGIAFDVNQNTASYSIANAPKGIYEISVASGGEAVGDAFVVGSANSVCTFAVSSSSSTVNGSAISVSRPAATTQNPAAIDLPTNITHSGGPLQFAIQGRRDSGTGICTMRVGGYLSVKYSPDSSQIVLRGDITNVAVEAAGTPTGSLSAANATIWGTESRDTTVSYNAATGEFTAPIAGDYCFAAGVIISGTEALDSFYSLQPYVNGTARGRFGGFQRAPGTITSNQAQSNGCTFLNRSDILTFRTNTNVTGAAFAAAALGENYLAIYNASGGVPKPFIPSSMFAGRTAVVKVAAFDLNCDASSSITENPDGAVATIANQSGADCAGTFTAGFWTTAPICVSNAKTSAKLAQIQSVTTTTFNFRSGDDDGGAASTGDATFVCIGQ